MVFHRSGSIFLLCSFLISWIGVPGNSCVCAQEKDFILPVQSSGELIFDVDVCQYKGQDEHTLVEILYRVEGNQFSDSSDSLSVLTIDIRFFEMDLKEWHEIKRIHRDKTESPEGNFTFIDLKHCQCKQKTLSLEITIQDSASGRKGSILKSFETIDFSKGLSMSDLYFISSLQRAKGGSIFEKNGLLMIPSVSRYYTVDDSSKKAYIYYEINGMDFNESEISYYDTRFFVYTLSGEEIASGFKEFIPKKSSETARVEVVPLGGLKTGMYRLSVLVTDLSAKRTVTRERYFRISSEEDKAMILPMSDADIENYLKQIQYIATSEEKKLFKRLNARGKQTFLLDFWRSRDSIPETPENEFMLAYFQKLNYAETHFKGGIDSDMGRIYIQYGPPMDIQREFSHIEYEKPVEIWTYAQDGRIEFIFVDRSGDNRFVLVHSTHVDEYSNPNWMDELID